MYGQPPRLHRGGGGGNRPPHQTPPQPNSATAFQNPNAFPFYGSHMPNANAPSSAWTFQNSFGFNPHLHQTQNPNHFPIQNPNNFPMQNVNAFVHCFVGVQRITSLYDLKVAICRNESVDDFEALGLGPFLRHPLIMHYFSIRSDVTEVFKITGGEIVHLLCEFLDESRNKEIKIDESWSSLPRSDRFNAGKGLALGFRAWDKSFCGKHIRFVSSSSDDEVSDCSTVDDQDDDIINGSLSTSTSKFGKSSERVSTCPYPSATEEMERLRGKSDAQGLPHSNGSIKQELSGPLRKKRKSENVASSMSAPSKVLKKDKLESVATRIEKGTTTKLPRYTNKDLSIANDSLQMFVTTWKEACRDHTVAEVLERMLLFYNVRPQRRKKTMRMFTSYPLVGLLNAAVSSIKSGMWNSIYDNLQAINHNELTNSLTTSSEYETIDVGPSIEHVPVVRKDSVEYTKHSVEDKKCVSDEDIIRKIANYFDIDNEVNRNYNSPLQCRITLLRKFCNYESWVAEQFDVKDFNYLGFGDFLLFIEKFVKPAAS